MSLSFGWIFQERVGSADRPPDPAPSPEKAVHANPGHPALFTFKN